MLADSRRSRWLAIALVLAAPVAPAGDRAEPPNVLFILADDVGYADIGIYGVRVPAPNIDALARDGMRFTDAHSPRRCVPRHDSAC